MYPNWEFWYENIPSGNPDTMVGRNYEMEVVEWERFEKAISWLRDDEGSQAEIDDQCLDNIERHRKP
jgi:hypothetical protein